MRPLHQINERTGLSADYFNEYMECWLLQEHVDEVKACLADYQIRTYAERFQGYDLGLNEEQKASVARLDGIAQRLNARDFSQDELRALLAEAHKLIFG